MDQMIPTDRERRVFAAVEEIRPLLESEADASERQRYLTDRIWDAMKAKNLYYLLLPEELGGWGVDFVVAHRVVERLAHAYSSAGWCILAQAAWTAAMVTYTGDKAARRMVANHIALGGQGTPNGRAERTPQGYRLNGRWSYGSGMMNSELIACTSIIYENGEMLRDAAGNPEIRCFAVEKADVNVLDNWDVIGLRGTGSFDYEIRDKIIDPDYSLVATSTTPARGGDKYTVGIVGLITVGHSGWAIGTAARALDEIRHLAVTKKSLNGLTADSVSFQEKFAIAEAQLIGARQYCEWAWTRIDESLRGTGRAPLELISHARMAQINAHYVGSEVCGFAHKYGGGTSLRPSVLQRCFRDMHAATQHAVNSHQIVQGCGRVFLGTAPANAAWDIARLV